MSGKYLGLARHLLIGPYIYKRPIRLIKHAFPDFHFEYEIDSSGRGGRRAI